MSRLGAVGTTLRRQTLANGREQWDFPRLARHRARKNKGLAHQSFVNPETTETAPLAPFIDAPDVPLGALGRTHRRAALAFRNGGPTVDSGAIGAGRAET